MGPKKRRRVWGWRRWMPRPARKEEEEEEGRVEGEEGEEGEEEAARRVKPSKKMARIPAWEKNIRKRKGFTYRK